MQMKYLSLDSKRKEPEPRRGLFEIPNRVEIAYRSNLSKLINREIPVGLTHNNIDEWLDALASISYDESFQSASSAIANAMVRDVSLSNSSSWNEALRRSIGAERKLFDSSSILTAKTLSLQLKQSTQSITAIPYKVAAKLRKEINEARDKGATEQGCLNILRYRFPNLMSMRIKLLSRTQPHSINSNLTEARSSSLALHCFIWTTTGDALVRVSHQKINGVVVFWSHLPSPEALIGLPSTLGHYSPGNCPNCRCLAFPVFSVEDLFKNARERLRVYYEGSIHRVTRAQFERLVV